MEEGSPFRTRLSAEELRHIRLLLGATQRELGEFIGHSARTVQQWEQGRRRIPQGVAALVTHDCFSAEFRAARGTSSAPAVSAAGIDPVPRGRGRPRKTPALAGGVDA